MSAARFAVLGILLFAARAHSRVEFVLIHDGQPLKGGEVCFYRTALPASDTHPSRYWFDNNDVRCLPAGVLLDLPVGRLHYFARHGDGFVSAFKSSYVADVPSAPDAYSRLELSVFSATRVDVHTLRQPLAAGEWLAFATADSTTNVGMVFPVPDDADDLLLPVDWPVLPLVIRDRLPVRIGSPLTLRRGEQPRIQMGPEPGTGDVLTWIDMDWALLQSMPKEELDRLAPPAVALQTGSRTFDPVLPTRHARSAFATLQVFKHVPPGKARLQLHGRTWEADEVPVDVPAGRLVTASRPLRAAPAAAVRVEYAVAGSAVPLASAASRTCDAPVPTDMPVQLKLYRCAEPATEPFDVDKCAPAGMKEAELSSAAAEFLGIPTGNYILEAVHSALGTLRQARHLRPGEDAEARFEVPAYAVFGTVTRGGEPLRVELLFLGGSKFEKRTATDEGGRFETILPVAPGKVPVEIKACAGTFELTYVPESPIGANQQMDIVIPGGSIRASVVDEATKRALPGSVVGLVTEASTPRQAMRRAVADETGTAEFIGVSHGEVKVCARHAGYRDRCLDVLLREDEAKPLVVGLSSEALVRGRLEPAGAYDISFLYWADRFGRVTERARVEADGTFALTRNPGPDEYIVLSSTTLPLCLIDRWAKSSDGELVVPVPVTAPRRSFSVRMSPDDRFRSRFVGISIGERLVPPDAFALHLTNRGTDSVVRRDVPLRVRDIAATAPITVILGPSRDEIPPGPFPDNWLIEPSFAPLLKRQRLPDGVDTVTF